MINQSTVVFIVGAGVAGVHFLFVQWRVLGLRMMLQNHRRCLRGLAVIIQFAEDVF